MSNNLNNNHQNNNAENNNAENNNIELVNSNLHKYIQEYIDDLTDIDLIVMQIAKEHLESSFCIERSVGFIKWLNDKSYKLESE